MKTRGGLLVFRVKHNQLEVLISHHGGPLWAKRDVAAWSIFKGEQEDGEELQDTAKREFREETSHQPPAGPWYELGFIKRKDGTVIHAWAAEGDYDSATIHSNMFTMEWPPRSGKRQEFPENDRAEWFDLPAAMVKLHEGQQIFIERLVKVLQHTRPDLDMPDLQAAQLPEQPSLF